MGEFANSVILSLTSVAAKARFEILLYCLMPDHLHLLVLGTADDANVLRLVQRFKQQTGHQFKQRYGQALWQQSFFDHVVRLEEDILPIARYIVGNPVAARLVKEPQDWAYLGGTLWDAAEATSLHSLFDV